MDRSLLMAQYFFGPTQVSPLTMANLATHTNLTTDHQSDDENGQQV
jgi:hypothetical protein